MAYRYLEQEDVDGGDYDVYSGETSYVCPSWAPAVGFLGITSAVVFASKYSALSHCRQVLFESW